MPSSPIFNGDQYSMGGNGEAVTHKGGYIGTLNVPAGPGGGCVKTGPFAKYVVLLLILFCLSSCCSSSSVSSSYQ
jgi:tyrosinase